MIVQVLYCLSCQDTNIVWHGKSSAGTQRYHFRGCRQGRGCTFLFDDSYAVQAPKVKEQIVEMAMNASGIRNTKKKKVFQNC